jgi:predicted ABC-type ATPase
LKKKKPILIVIAGPNGSGKTSITSKILKHEWIENCIYINPDNIANEVFGDWNSAYSVLKTAKYSQELREKFINVGTTYSKSIANPAIISKFVDRLYVYDNSVEYKNPKLLFRSVNGQIKKSYNRHHEWAMPIYENIYNK